MHNVGVFTRLVWKDGKTEDVAFTAVSFSGEAWRRADDTCTTELTAPGISAVDLIIGDGARNYYPEHISESYYGARLFNGFFTTLHARQIGNPAYNHDRGPLWACSLRLHFQTGKK